MDKKENIKNERNLFEWTAKMKEKLPGYVDLYYTIPYEVHGQVAQVGIPS